MNLVQFLKPRARQVRSYTQQHGWRVTWLVNIGWNWHGKGYMSQGEHADLECAFRHAMRPIIEQGWLRYFPAYWLLDSLKPLQVMTRLDFPGEVHS